MPLRLNPLTGEFDLVNGNNSTATIDGSVVVEYRTISATEDLNKEITLINTPANPLKVSLDIISGTSQEIGVDFEVIGNILRWSGKALEMTLSENDKIRIQYFL